MQPKPDGGGCARPTVFEGASRELKSAQPSQPHQREDHAFFRQPFRNSSGLDRWFGDFSPGKFAPSVEVAEEEKALRVTAELPGMNREDVRLSLDNGALVVSGEKKSDDSSDDEGVYRNERFYGYFQRTIPLPEDVDHDNAEASFENGVLTVRLPKLKAESRAQRIEIS